MTASPREPALNRSATIVVALCVALLAGTAMILVVPGLRSRVVPTVQPTSGYAEGEQVDLPSDLFDVARATVVVFGQATCATCQQWAPSLSRLIADLQKTSEVGVLLVVDSAGDVPADDGLARAIGVDDAAVRRVPFRSLRLKAVPTLLVVDRGGRIVVVSVGGVLDGNRTDDLLRRIHEDVKTTARADAR